MSADTIVLGAGPAGLGAALALGRRAIVLEREAEVAGLCRTLVLDGAVFDLGGHSFHTPHPQVRKLVFDSLEMEEQPRQAWCWVAGQWIPYPFQKHFEALTDAAMRESCAAGLADASDWKSAPDYDAYLTRRFGPGISELFMRPYNRKLWGGDLSRMSADWTGERVAAPRGSDERFVEDGGRRTPLQADTTIAYPARGGFGEIFRALALRVSDLRLSQSVRRIDTRTRRLETSNGDTFGWRNIVSTLPLPALLKLLSDVPQEMAEAVTGLEALPITLVMLVLEGQGATERQRVYCPEENVIGHKIVLNHTSSSWLRALPRHGIQVEVSGTRSESDAELAAKALAGLIAMGVIAGTHEVRRTEVLRLPLGYPVPTHARKQVMSELRAWLGERDIHLAGRFAEWAYINSDEALHRGLATGERLAGSP